MTSIVSEFDPVLKDWPKVTTAGISINGQGVRRPGSTRLVGGRTATSGEDVTNQHSDTVKGV